MKNFFKNNKYFALYLVGTLAYVSSQFRYGNGRAAIAVLLFAIVLFFYLYWINRR